MQDADKQRPYYGRALGAWVHFTRDPTSGWPDFLVSGHGWVPAHLDPPQTRPYPRRMYAKYVQTISIPVHSRDAACPRPAHPRTQRANVPRTPSAVTG